MCHERRKGCSDLNTNSQNRYDVFLSYARLDNEPDSDGKCQVSEFVEVLQKVYGNRTQPGNPLRIFFDKEQIVSGDLWEQRIRQALNQSSCMIAVVSKNYLDSEWCDREWDLFERHLAMRMSVDKGIMPLAVVPLEGLMGYLESSKYPSWNVRLSPVQNGELNVRTIMDFLTDQFHSAQQTKTLLERVDSVSTVIRWIDEINDRRNLSAKSFAYGAFPSVNPRFVGRIAELRKLRIDLTEGYASVVTTGGIAGIGKTQLALAYAHAYSWDYQGGRWFIRCEGQKHLGQHLTKVMSVDLDLTIPDTASSQVDGGFSHIRKHIATRPNTHKILVILDNVDEDELITTESISNLNIDKNQFDILVTSRRRLGTSTLNDPIRCQTIGLLSDDELFTILGLPQSPDDLYRQAAQKLFYLTGHLTLAIEIVGRYLAKEVEYGETLISYVDKLESDVLDMLETTVRRGGNILHEEKYIDHMFFKSIDRCSDKAKQVLNVACLMHPDFLVHNWLKDLCCLEGETVDITEFESAVRELVDASLLTPPAGQNGVRLYQIHRLVAESMRGYIKLNAPSEPHFEWHESNDIVNYMSNVADELLHGRSFPNRDRLFWIEVVNRTYQHIGYDAFSLVDVNALGEINADYGNVDQAINQFLYCYERSSESIDSGWEYLGNISECYLRQNRSQSAIESVSRAIAELDRSDSHLLFERAMLLSIQAKNYISMKEFTTANELSTEIRSLSALNSDQVSDFEGLSMAVMGDSLFAEKNFDGAIECYLKATRSYESSQRNNDKYIEQIQYKLGRSYVQKNPIDYESSRICTEKALELARRTYGPVHHKVAKLLSVMGDNLHGLSRFDDAIQCYRECITIYQSVGNSDKINKTQKKIDRAIHCKEPL